ncbi:MAG: hypothetical protein IJT50_07750 [Lentisphaeria bacterium]|nr:hypothetical protein [Lentisphaeria bacterium]
MDITIRQGTVYLEKASGKRFVLVNHNPMALESLRFWSASEDAPFDLGAPERITVDELIALRNSGQYEELGDLPPELFRQLAGALLAAGNLPETDLALIRALLEDGTGA